MYYFHCFWMGSFFCFMIWFMITLARALVNFRVFSDVGDHFFYNSFVTVISVRFWGTWLIMFSHLKVEYIFSVVIEDVTLIHNQCQFFRSSNSSLVMLLCRQSLANTTHRQMLIDNGYSRSVVSCQLFLDNVRKGTLCLWITKTNSCYLELFVALHLSNSHSIELQRYRYYR